MSKVPCGGFKLDENFLGMNENDELSLTGGGDGGEGKAYQYLVTDGDGKTKWEDRLAYDYTEWKDFALNSVLIPIDGFTMPSVGDTVTVKVNGVESVETVKSGESEGSTYSYIGSADFISLMSGNNGWCVAHVAQTDQTLGLANPKTNISLIATNQHKIDEKYIPQDKNFVRPLSYYTMNTAQIYKTYYNESGDYIDTYKCSNIIMPKINETVFIYDRGDVGIGQFANKRVSSFDVSVYRFYNGTMHYESQIYGTDETEIAELAADEGYTLTTKPTT